MNRLSAFFYLAFFFVTSPRVQLAPLRINDKMNRLSAFFIWRFFFVTSPRVHQEMEEPPQVKEESRKKPLQMWKELQEVEESRKKWNNLVRNPPRCGRIS